MELTKEDNQMAKGIAIIGMVMLHLFCRRDNLPYTPLLWIGNVPLIYYFGLFGDICVPIFCFCSGYAQALLVEKEKACYFRKSIIRLLKFLLNYWLVLIIFSIVGFFFDSKNLVPGSVSKFVGNFFLYAFSYNPAWWFVLTYLFLIFTTIPITMLMKKIHPIISICASGGVYFVAYIFRFSVEIHLSSTLLQWLWNQIILYGTSQFMFVVGIACYQNKTVSKLRNVFKERRYKNMHCILFLLLMLIFHGIVQTLAIAPLTALVVLCCFYISDIKNSSKKILMIAGKHSTNIWLTHMFFYFMIFDQFLFIVKYPLLICIFSACLLLAVSVCIDYLYQKMLHLLGL